MISRTLTLAVVLILSSVSFSAANKKVTLQLRWDHQFQFAGYYVAEWKGFYDEVGLDVEIKSAIEDHQILSTVEEVGAKRAEFGIGAADILKARADGVPLVVIASIFQNSPSAFYTREETIIRSPADFTKLKVARRINDLIDIEFQAVLKSEGIDHKRITAYPHQPGLDHLISGDVDVVPGYSINIPFTAESKNFPVKELRPARYGIDFYGDSIFTHNDTVQRDPEMVRRFREASIKGWQYALEHREETIEYIVANLPRVKTVDDLRKFNRFQCDGIVEITHYPVIEIGHINPDRWLRMHEALKSIGIVKGELALDEFVFKPEEAAKSETLELRRIIRYTAFSLVAVLAVTGVWVQVLRRAVKARTREYTEVNRRLQESDERFHLAMDAAQDGLYDWNLLTNAIYYSPSWKRMLGYEDHELENNFDVWENLTHKEDITRAWNMQNELIQRKRERFEMEFRMRHKSGHWVDILSRALAVFNQEGEAIRIVGTHVDITRQKQLLKELQKLSQDQSAILDNVPAYIYFKDKENNIIKVSNQVATATGLPKEAIEGHHSSEIYPETADMYWKDDLEVIDSGEPKLGIVEPLPVESGETRWLYTNKVPYWGKDGEVAGIIVFSIDITDRKKVEDEKLALEKELSQSQKMESIGTLAGGIAHEFNNILSIIIGNNELIMDEVPKGSLERDSCEEIRLAGLRAKDIVKQLLTFSRQDSSTLEPLDLRYVVSESLKLIRAATPTNIEIREKISDDCLPIFGNVTQINQVLINLCSNAIDSLPDSNGILEVELFNTEIALRSEKLLPGKYVKLIVRDNGCGMDESVIERVFEPYFTTKEIGKGTGIGLAVVHGIVENHHGTIACESTIHSGTTFSILLPAYLGTMEKTGEKKAELPKGAETILYIDDEAVIAKLGERHLKSLGYDVISITDPTEALELFAQNPERFDLVISDMAMPQLPGDHLLQRMLEIRPELPTIICTGYSSRISEAEAMRLGIKAFLMKPLSKLELAEKVRSVLDNR